MFWGFDVPQQKIFGGVAPRSEDVPNALHVDGRPADLLPYRDIFSHSVDVRLSDSRRHGWLSS